MTTGAVSVIPQPTTKLIPAASTKSSIYIGKAPPPDIVNLNLPPVNSIIFL